MTDFRKEGAAFMASSCLGLRLHRPDEVFGGQLGKFQNLSTVLVSV